MTCGINGYSNNDINDNKIIWNERFDENKQQKIQGGLVWGKDLCTILENKAGLRTGEKFLKDKWVLQQKKNEFYDRGGMLE